MPAFDSPFADEATVPFLPAGDAAGRPAQLFVGRYEARVTPVADTDPTTPLSDTFKLVPGTYELIARADGFGAVRTTLTVQAGQVRDLPVPMLENYASRFNGASATGDGTERSALIDDTEATNWASLGGRGQAGDRAARPVGRPRDVPPHPGQRAAAHAPAGGRERPVAEPVHGAAPVPAARLPGRRSGRLHAGRAVHVRAHQPGGRVPLRRAAAAGARADAALVRRPADAGDARPRAGAHEPVHRPDRLHGDPDDDPLNDADCRTGSTQDDNVRAAELQVFAR